MKIVNPMTFDSGKNESIDIMKLPVLEDFNPDEKWVIPVKGENGEEGEISVQNLIDIISRANKS
jgi:hypothetical protein